MTYLAPNIQKAIGILGINAKTIAITSLTNNSAMSFIPREIWLVATTLSGVATGPTFSVGNNATSYNNMLASTSWSPSTQGQFAGYFAVNGAALIAPGGTVNLNITTGSTSTAMLISWYLKGIYV